MPRGHPEICHSSTPSQTNPKSRPPHWLSEKPIIGRSAAQLLRTSGICLQGVAITEEAEL